MSGLYWLLAAGLLWCILTFVIWCVMRSASKADDAAERWEKEYRNEK
jgi:hypothetical protein